MHLKITLTVKQIILLRVDQNPIFSVLLTLAAFSNILHSLIHFPSSLSVRLSTLLLLFYLQNERGASFSENRFQFVACIGVLYKLL